MSDVMRMECVENFPSPAAKLLEKESNNILSFTLIGDQLSLAKLKIDGISSVSAEGTEP